MRLLPIKRALLSVTDKTGLVPFASFLSAAGVHLVSTGGTFATLAQAGLPVTQVSQLTGFPEILDGRVKTLHPMIHGGILADKDNPEHCKVLQEHAIEPFDLVCVNLYDFASAVEKGLDRAGTIEQIDIGGPCLLRAAAKNFSSVLVVPGTQYYAQVEKDLQANAMHASLALRQTMARHTFTATSAYDQMIVQYLATA